MIDWFVLPCYNEEMERRHMVEMTGNWFWDSDTVDEFERFVFQRGGRVVEVVSYPSGQYEFTIYPPSNLTAQDLMDDFVRLKNKTSN